MSPTFILSDSDLEKLLNSFDASEKGIKAAREVLNQSYSKPAESPQAPSGSGVEWKVKGGALANAEDGWAWAFAIDRDGKIPADREQLIDHLKRFGKVTQSGYEITLSRDGKFLNRKKLQEGGR